MKLFFHALNHRYSFLQHGVVTAGVEGTYSTVERAVTRAHSTMSLYNLHEAVDDNAAASGHRHCSIYTFNWVAMGWAGNEDRGGVSTATTTSLSLAIVAGRNMLRRRCYGPETSRYELIDNFTPS
jgi:hypothetical protein